MSNVLDFANALAARNARITDRKEYAASLQGFGAVANEKVRQAQIALTFVGYPAGTADGLWGPNTDRAARSFASSRGVDQPSDGAPWNEVLSPAFDAALSRRLAEVKGQQQQNVIQAPGAAGGGSTAITTAPPGVVLPWYEQAKLWLLAPDKPVYQKPVLYLGAGIVALTIFLALRKQD